MQPGHFLLSIANSYKVICNDPNLYLSRLRMKSRPHLLFAKARCVKVERARWEVCSFKDEEVL